MELKIENRFIGEVNGMAIHNSKLFSYVVEFIGILEDKFNISITNSLITRNVIELIGDMLTYNSEIKVDVALSNFKDTLNLDNIKYNEILFEEIVNRVKGE